MLKGYGSDMPVSRKHDEQGMSGRASISDQQ
jgi:hypothetical protein